MKKKNAKNDLKIVLPKRVKNLLESMTTRDIRMIQKAVNNLGDLLEGQDEIPFSSAMPDAKKMILELSQTFSEISPDKMRLVLGGLAVGLWVTGSHLLQAASDIEKTMLKMGTEEKKS